jgi:predicted acyl esterase
VTRARLVLAAAALLATWASAASASAAQVTHDVRFTASDGVELQTKVGGEGSLLPRPVIVEFSPYAPGCCAQLAGPDYNYLQVHIRGTGDSDGRFDALGPRTQRDVAEVLEWACRRPWSDGRLGLYGFSASAITVYNALNLRLPCVGAAVLGAGTHELYRDLMYPGGIPNLVPAAGVALGIGGLSLAAGPARVARNPLSGLDAFLGHYETGMNYLRHPTLDWWWRERGMRGDVNDIPILMVTGFFDVESRGPFETFRELRGDGAHLLVIGAHDGTPSDTDGGTGERRRWFDRHLRGIRNGVEDDPRVRLWLADGDREDMLAGKYVRVDGDDWPLPGTRWRSLALHPARSGTARSLNDGSLRVRAPRRATQQRYPVLPSLPTATDQHTTSLAPSGGLLPTDMTLAEGLGLSYTTAPLARDMVAAGPAALELRLSSTAPQTDIYAVLSDVWPDGTPHPVATGRLRSAYPAIDRAHSLKDPRTGAIVQPYGRYDVRMTTSAGRERLYRVEFWPLGNRFRSGHRLRLHVLGASAFHLPSGVAVNTVRVGGRGASRLLIPVVPHGEGAPR